MRKIIIILLLFFCPILAYAQVHKYRAFEDKLIENKSYEKQSDWQQVNILITIGIDKIRIFAETESNIDIIKSGDIYTNSNGDRQIDYVGVDQNGTKCTGSIIIFQGSIGRHVGSLVLEYSNFSFIYRLKEND